VDNLSYRAGRNDRDLLKHLPCAAQAAFNSSDKQHASRCLLGTRVDVLARIREWADGRCERGIFWLNGMAGTGKSTIALTIAREYDERGRLGASFFFSRGGGDLGSSSKVFTTLAAQLANKLPDLKNHIRKAVADIDISNLGLYDQWQKLILEPLSRLEESSLPLPLVLVVDALDECEGEEDVRLVLQLFATAKSLQKVQLRIFITSRPETPIRHGIYDIPEAAHQDFVLHEISLSVIEHDISIFFRHNLESIEKECGLAMDWPREQTVRLLVQRSGGLFIYAATACRFIRQGGNFAQRRLTLLLQHDNTTLLPEKKLDEIYTTILAHSANGEYDEQEIKDLRKNFGQTVGSIVVLFNTLSVTSLAGLLKTPAMEINQTLIHLHSVLDVPKSQDGVIRLLHPSFCDFLLDEQRCLNPQFWVDKKQAHRHLFACCLQIMSDHLRRDICNLREPGARTAEINKIELTQHIPLHVQYACRYWIHHLEQGNIDSRDYSNVQRFLQKHFIHWLEALAIIGCMSEGVLMVKLLDSMLTVSESTRPISRVAN
jgi:hypothetical protein